MKKLAIAVSVVIALLSISIFEGRHCSSLWAQGYDHVIVSGLDGSTGRALKVDSEGKLEVNMSEMSGDIATSGDLTVSGANIGTAPRPEDDELYVEGDVGITEDLTLGGTAEIAGATTISSDLTLEGTTSDLYTDGGIYATADNSGVLTLGGSGGTNNENLTLDFETTSDRALISTTEGSRITFVDENFLGFGTGTDSKLLWTAIGNDNLQLGLKVNNADYSGYFSIMEYADMQSANRSPSSTSADPVLRVYSSDVDVATDYIEMYHNQTSGYIKAGIGEVYLDAISGIVLDSELGQFYLRHTGSNLVSLRISPTTDEFFIAPTDGAGNQVIITAADHFSVDHDHVLQDNPTLYVHSDKSPDDDNTEWLSLTHDTDGGIIDVGSGALKIQDNVAISGGLTTDGSTHGVAIGTSAPSSPVAGSMYYDDAAHRLYIYDGSAWDYVASVTDG